MQPLLAALIAADFHVQLKHVSKETKWEDTDRHGFVALKGSNGVEIVRRGGFQHNRKLRDGGAFDARAVESLVGLVTSARAAGQLGSSPPQEEKAARRSSFLVRIFQRRSSAGAPAAASA